MSEVQTILGTPPPVMLPARNYCFNVKDEHYVISIPRRGSYHDLDPDFFPEDSGYFDIFDEEKKILYMPAVTKVMFAASKYPVLVPNQFFVPYVYSIKENTVDIVGQLVEVVPHKADEEVTEE
jgi:hypothetical protein